ncbi:hypothetical protein PsorP6_009078 [Peronosclerospora sorghi]|uniref:Uncharacterized protein n=1 Tax=Peronosclerospora sorghi TaxID=230839 RepID=A0ACC0W183_9STRA|nr:hypothetical protein PsorP6_009078 [Peronosclerospora sorghi]
MENVRRPRRLDHERALLTDVVDLFFVHLVPHPSTSNRMFKRVLAYIFLISIVCAFSSGLSMMSSVMFQWIGRTRRTRVAKQLPIAKYERNLQRTLLEHLLEDQFVLDRIPFPVIEHVHQRETVLTTADASVSRRKTMHGVSENDKTFVSNENERSRMITDEITYQSVADSDAETCPICLDDFEDGADVKVLPCQHFFHVECINPWLEGRSGRCPLCKQDAIATSFKACIDTLDNPLRNQCKKVDVKTRSGTMNCRSRCRNEWCKILETSDQKR